MRANSLKDVQRRMADFCLGTASEFPVPIRFTETFSKDTRLAVYRDGIRARFCDLIRSDFPVTARILGEADLWAVVGRYVAQRPPDSPILRDYSEGFPLYISEDLIRRDYPYLADLAKYEWFKVEMRFVLPEVPAAMSDLEKVATLPAQEVGLDVIRHARFQRTDYPVHLLPGKNVSLAKHWYVHFRVKHGEKIERHSALLSQIEWDLGQKIRRFKNLEKSIAGLSLAPETLQAAFQKLMSIGLIGKVYPDRNFSGSTGA